MIFPNSRRSKYLIPQFSISIFQSKYRTFSWDLLDQAIPRSKYLLHTKTRFRANAKTGPIEMWKMGKAQKKSQLSKEVKSYINAATTLTCKTLERLPLLLSQPRLSLSSRFQISSSMATARNVKDVSPHEFVKAYAAHLKRSGKMELPEWTDIVKTGVLKELAPYDPDWYYIRAASMARKIYLRGGLGVGAFRRIYGGSKRNGSRPPHFGKASGSVARNILQQLQTMNIIELDTRGGRKITSSGQRDLDQVAGRIVVVAP